MPSTGNTLFRMYVTALCTKYKVISCKNYEEISDFSLNTQYWKALFADLLGVDILHSVLFLDITYLTFDIFDISFSYLCFFGLR